MSMILSQKLIVDILLEPHLAEKLTLSEWSQVIFVLRENELLARFYYLAVKANSYSNYPDSVQHHLHSAKVIAEKQAKQAIYEATELTENLSVLKVQPIFLKGVAYTLLSNGASIGRTYSDMDVLVHKKDLTSIEQRLTMFGWFAKKIDDYDQKYYREWAHEIPPLYQNTRGTVADIHHNLLPPISGRAPEINLFTQNLVTTEQGLLTLSKSSLVMHSIIHLFFNEEFTHGFRDITDLHLLFSDELSNHHFWEALLLLSQQSKFTAELYFAVRYCQKIMRTPFPEHFKNRVDSFKPNAITLCLGDLIFTKVLNPNHSSFIGWQHKVARLLGVVRGHMIKMPLHILIYHSFHKLYVEAFKRKEASKPKI